MSLTTSSLIQIDGSYGEGGGQIIRTSLSLSAMTGRPVDIVNVRARRARPGLQPQHLTAVQAAASLCAAELRGAAVGSTQVTFRPQKTPQPGPYRFDIGTAGATPLVAQTVFAPLVFSPAASTITIIGGTHVPHAPTAEYLEQVYFPCIRAIGLDCGFDAPKAGFYPRGGGEIHLSIPGGARPEPIELVERGKLRRLRAFIVTSQLPDHVAERGETAVLKFMRAIGRTVSVERRDRPSNGAGAAVVLAAECEGGIAGFSSIGERGKPMEKVAHEACEDFLAWWKTGAACDVHLADQLVLPLSLTRGESCWTTPMVTEHLLTVLWVASQFLPIQYSIEERGDGSSLVRLTAQP